MNKQTKRGGIALRLILYFTITLATFAVIAGILFYSIISKLNLDTSRDTMIRSATSIASSYSVFNDDMGEGRGHESGKGEKQGYGIFAALAGSLTDSEVWLVAQDNQLIVPEHGGSSFSSNPLPEGAQEIVSAAFGGTATAGEYYSENLGKETITAGAPVTSADGTVEAVVLVNAPVQDVTSVTESTIRIMAICFAAALAAGLIAAAFLARSFTRPLIKMEQQAHSLAEGDYEAKSNVKRSDEFGSLASSLDTLADKLRLSAQEQERYQRMQQDFFSKISHELRTPVTVLTGSLELLDQNIVTDPEEVASYHRELYEESRSLERLVADLLELSRLGNTDFSLTKSEVNFSDISADAARTAGRLGAPKNVDVKFSSDTPFLPFDGDYARLRQMLLAVLDNAVKFSPEGGTVELTQKDGVIEVRDFGPGIRQEDKDKIFDRFWKTEGPSNPGGTGLGLAIARSIADRHDIRIVVPDTENGTIIRFILPDRGPSELNS